MNATRLQIPLLLAVLGCQSTEDPTLVPTTTSSATPTVPSVATPEVVPRLAIVSPANGTVVESAAVEITAEILDGAAAGVSWRAGDTVLDEQNGPFEPGALVSLQVDLTSGPNVITIEALSPSGQSDVREVVVVLDSPEPPLLSLAAPEPDTQTEASVYTVRGEVFAEDEPIRAELTIDGVVDDLPLTPADTGAWTFAVDVDLPYGATELIVEFEDLAGQVTRAERTVTRNLDEVPPELHDVWPTDDHGLASTANLVWGQVTDNDTVASVEIEQDGVRTPAIVDVDGRFHGYLHLSRGSGAYAVVATDASGNETRLDRSVWLGSRVSAGGSHSGWIVPDGSLAMWGRNNIGQIGLGTVTALGDTEPPHPDVPTLVTVAGAPVSLAAYQNTTVLLTDDGTLWGWGENGSGQLGLGTPDPTDLFVELDQTVPVHVPALTDVATIAGGYYHTLALLDDGTVKAMGRNSDGQLGDGTEEDRDHATTVAGLSNVVQVAAASSSSFAVTTAGELYAWGANDYGQLGTGVEDDDAHPTPTLVPGLPPVAMVAAGRDHVLVVLESGEVWGWGLNGSYQVGGPSNGIVDSPVLTPTALPHLGTAVAVYANGNQSYLETADALLHGWGQNGTAGALGVPATGDLEAPIGPVFGLTQLADAGIGALHSVALRSDDQAFAWGWSFQGSLGGQGLINAWGYRIPIQVTDPTSAP